MHEKPMTSEEQSAHEYEKSPETMGHYLQKFDVQEKTVVDFGCGWGG